MEIMWSFGWGPAVVLGYGAFLVTMFCEAARRGEKWSAFVFAIFALLLLFLGGAAAFNRGRQEEKILRPTHAYIVIAKGQSSFGTPLSVRDMANDEDRIIVSKEYPPAGFIEATTAEGKIMLLPKKK